MFLGQPPSATVVVEATPEEPAAPTPPTNTELCTFGSIILDNTSE